MKTRQHILNIRKLRFIFPNRNLSVFSENINKKHSLVLDGISIKNHRLGRYNQVFKRVISRDLNIKGDKRDKHLFPTGKMNNHQHRKLGVFLINV